MAELVKCPFCEQEIEENSLFCDQCGEMLKLCVNGHGFKRGKICNQCGTPLIEAKIKHSEEKIAPLKEDENAKATPRFLAGKNINAQLAIKDGIIIGRRTGDYISTFASLGYISGTHAKFQMDNQGNCTITDLDSTNGTFVNGKQLTPHTPTTVNVGDEISFYDTLFIIE